MRHLFLAPTFLALASIAAAREAGLYPEVGHATLLVTDDSPIPEVSAGVLGQAGADTLLAGFDGVLSYNTLIHPYHPLRFAPRDTAREELIAAIVEACGGAAPDAITVPSLHRKPASALVELFPEARVHLLADGLADYGPAPTPPAARVARRVERVLHGGLVPDVEPVALADRDVPSSAIPANALRAVLTAAAASAGIPDRAERDRPDALLLGERRTSTGPEAAAAEESLHLDLVRAAVARGARSLVFSPHPSAPPAPTFRLAALAAELGATFEATAAPTPAEVLIERLHPRTVVGQSGTGLATASTVLGVEACAVGAVDGARALSRFDHPDRVPLALSHAMHARAAVDGADVTLSGREPADMQALVDALGHAMRPSLPARGGAARRGELLAARPDLAPFFEGAPSSAARAARGHQARRLARGALRRLDRLRPAAVDEWIATVRAATLRLD